MCNLSCYFKRLKNYAPLCLSDQLVLTQRTLEELFLEILNENLRRQEKFAHATGVIKRLTGANWSSICKETEKLFVYSCLIFLLSLLFALETTASLGIFVAG